MRSFVDVHRPGTLTVTEREGHMTISITGRLDREIGSQLVELVQAAVVAGSPVALNVAGVHRWTWPGVDALGACLDLGAAVPASLGPVPRMTA